MNRRRLNRRTEIINHRAALARTVLSVGLVVAFVAPIIGGQTCSETAVAAEASKFPELESALNAYESAHDSGDPAAVKAVVYFPPAWEKFIDAHAAVVAARLKLAKAITDRWGDAAKQEFVYIHNVGRPPGLAYKVTGDTAILYHEQFPDAPPAHWFRKVGGKWKVDIAGDSKPGEENERIGYAAEELRIANDFTQRIAKGQYKVVSEAAAAYEQASNDVYSKPVAIGGTAVSGTVPPRTPLPVPPAPKPISNDEKLSLAPNVATIEKFVKDDVARLAGDDVDAASSARSELISGSISAKPDQPASAPYVQSYLSALSRELSAILAKNPNVRVKVNVAILAAKVAENVKPILPPGIQLQGLILSLMKDKNDAVALWGMKAAAAALSAPNQAAPNAELLRQVSLTVIDHKLNGPITDEAYRALEDPSPQVIKALMDLYEKRIAAYQNAAPEDPAVERRASTALCHQQGMWAKMSAADQKRVMNMIADLLAAATKAMADPPPGPDQLHQLITGTCEAVIVVALGQNQVDLAAQATRASKMSSNTPQPVVAQIINPLVDAIRKAFP